MINEFEREEISNELKNGFLSFFYFSLSLIENLSKENNNLKFAVVNMQISLELFLKYYFIMKDQPERVFYKKRSKRKFRDFSTVLNSYYSIAKTAHYADKRHLVTILESRNDIVHKGKFKVWDEDLAKYIISCVFFIQGVYRNEFDKTLIGTEYHPHKLSRNLIWKEGAVEFANKVTRNFNEKPFECPYCFSRSLIKKEIFDFDDQGDVENYQCLTCLCEVDTQISGAIVKCCQCEEKAYYVDRYNIQPNKTHFGGCLNCGNKMYLRHCENCEKFYFHSLQKQEIEFENNYFCSNDCLEIFKEEITDE